MPVSSSLSPSQAKALKSAADWHALLCSGNANDIDEQGLQHWLDKEQVNQWAWARVALLQQQLGGLPAPVVISTFDHAEKHVEISRRNLLKSTALMLVVAPLSWTAYRQGSFNSLLADEYTSVGETKSLILADGSTLTINTATAVDIHFSADERRLVLKQGEIMVETAKDPVVLAGNKLARPFIVETASGQIRALGTRFSVRYHDDKPAHTEVNIYQHRVEVTNLAGQKQIFNAGERLDFSPQHISAAINSTQSESWTRNMLVANNMTLDKFVTELNRYRVGMLRCDPTVAHYRISGAFKTTDTDQALRAIEKSFPVNINYRSRFWVSIAPK